MPTPWHPTTEARTAGGRFQIVARRPGHPPKDITFFRGAPTRLVEYSTADPFGWAGARIDFPQLTSWDAFGSGELYWLSDDTDVDIWWLPAHHDTSAEVVDPLTQDIKDDWFPTGAQKVWEGFMVTPNQRYSESEDGWGVDLLGALYQADGYKAKPMFPPSPITHEELLRRGLSRVERPHLRTAASGLRVEWPAGWTKAVTAEMLAAPTVFTPVGVKAGDRYTGYATRQTGGWDAWLTSFAQDLLAVMWVDDQSGVQPGNQWTLLCDAGRQPVLRIRDRFKTPELEVWFGTPGVEVTGLSRDATQASQVLYGEGSNLDGTVWRNTEFTIDPASGATLAGYVPLVADLSVHPTTADNKYLDTSRIIRERMVKYAPGISRQMAGSVAGQQAAWDRDPGWTGTMTLKTDPAWGSRWLVTAGMAVRVKGVLGSGAQGIVFHINETTANPEDGTVTCKIDTKFRDLLAFEEAVARTRDPLLPSKLLQINRRSVMIEDQLAPWDYTAGSGFIPTASKSFYKDIPRGSSFPHSAHAVTKQPISHSSYFVECNASSVYRHERWAQFSVLMSEKGTASHIEVAAYDRYGVQIDSSHPLGPVEFHLSLYYFNVGHTDMPADGLGPSPFIPDAFQQTTETGAPMPADWPSGPHPSLIVGWGNVDQPAGYSPGAKSDGDAATGRLVDSGTWTWDMTNNGEFDQFLPPLTQPQSTFTLYGMLYAEWPEKVYFMGRIFRQEQG